MGCSNSSQKRYDPANPQQHGAPPQLKQKKDSWSTILPALIKSEAASFINFAWLRNLRDEGGTIKRRQELPQEAFTETTKVLDLLNNYPGGIAVLSYCRLSKTHPDPKGLHLNSTVNNVKCPAIFWDFLSLHQDPRSEAEEALYKKATAAMHLFYSIQGASVFRIVDVPADCDNPIPYDQRGWTTFESAVAGAGKPYVYTIRGGQDVTRNQASPVPMAPARFNEIIETKQFTNMETDLPIVKNLYSSIWPEIKSTTEMTIAGWGDEEVELLLSVINELTELTCVTLVDRKTTKGGAAEQQLIQIMESRGGQAVDDYYHPL